MFGGGGEVDCNGFVTVDNVVEDFVVVGVLSEGTTRGDAFCSEPLDTLEVEVPASPTGSTGPGVQGGWVLLGKAEKLLVLGVGWLIGPLPFNSEDKPELTL